jgi:hypothetical protein
VVCTGILLLGMRYWFTPWRTRSIYAQQKEMQRPYFLSWNAEDITHESDTATVRTPWSDFLKWREGSELFVLYLSAVAFRIVPKRAFANQEAIDNFRALLREKIASKENQKRAA